MASYLQQAGCVRRKETKKTRKNRRTLIHHEIHSSPATATTSERRATKHILRASPYSPASRDPGFVEIDLVQLSQSVLVEMNEAGRPHSCSRPCAFEEKKNTKKSAPPTLNTTRNPQQPGDRDHLVKARDETRPAR